MVVERFANSDSGHSLHAPDVAATRQDRKSRRRHERSCAPAQCARQERCPGDRGLYGAARARSRPGGGVDCRPRAADLGTALSAPPRVVYEDRLYNAGAEGIIALVKKTASTVRTLLMVGHNPGLHDAARRLIASGDVETRERLNEGLPTSGLAVIDFAGKDWRKLHPHGGRLERFVSPRSLAEADRV